MNLADRIRSIFRRPPAATAPHFVQGITPGDARDRIREARAAFTWNGGLTSSWGGEKFPGALGYAGSWAMDYLTLRRRSRIAYWDSAQGRALLDRLLQNVVGDGLSLQATPSWSIVAPAMTEEARRTWTRDVETRFHLWAISKELDASGRMNAYELQRFAFLNVLRDGEILNILRASSDRSRMNPLELQFLRPEQMVNPGTAALIKAAADRGNTITDGIEFDATGRPVAYYIRDELKGTDTRIPRTGPKSGRLFFNHVGVWDSVGQTRGIPVLAPIVHELQKLTDYGLAEIEAAVVNALVAAYIKPSPTAQASRALSGVVERGTSAAQTDAGDTRNEPPSAAWISNPGLIIQTLKAGEDLASFDVKRPNVHFEAFIKAIKSMLSSSLGIPVEVLDMSFNANYSASRASLILFWNTVVHWRSFLASNFLNPIYRQWLAGEIAAGRITAPGWEESPVMTAAWLNCDWIGIPQPSIDPKAEAEADDLRIAQGSTTRERVASEYNGSSFSENVERLAIENAEIKDAQPEPPAPAPVEGQPPQRGQEPGPGREGDEARAVPVGGNGRSTH